MLELINQPGRSWQTNFWLKGVWWQLLMLSFCMSTFQVHARDFEIGVIAGIRGAGASYASGIVQGAEMAVSEINRHGGVNGRKLHLHIVDDASDPVRSAISMRRLVNSGPDVIVGGWGSPQVLAHLDLAEQAGIPYIVTSATNVNIITDADKWVFRVIQSDDIMARELAHQIYSRGFRSVAILHDRNAYGSGSRDLLSSALRGLNITPSAVLSYESAQSDFTEQLKKINIAAPDVIVLFGTVPAAPAIMKQARRMGIRAKFMGSGGLASELLIREAGDAAEGTILMSTYHPDVDRRTALWSQRYASLNKIGAAVYPAGAVKEYAAIHEIVAPCLRKTNAERASMRDCIAEWQGEFTGVVGNTRFDAKGQLVAPPIPVEISHGKFLLLKEAK